MFLLDVNVLIALGDPFHVHHEMVREWFFRHRAEGWATCPITENGFLRIVGRSNYPQTPGTPQQVRSFLKKLCALPGYQFFADSCSFVDSRKYPDLPSSKQLTDYYLLALAIEREAQLATIDRYIDPSLLPGGVAAYHLIHG